jgi:FkbM family methyltransferase
MPRANRILTGLPRSTRRKGMSLLTADKSLRKQIIAPCLSPRLSIQTLIAAIRKKTETFNEPAAQRKHDHNVAREPRGCEGASESVTCVGTVEPLSLSEGHHGKCKMSVSDELTLRLQSGSDLFVPHIGWLRYPSNDVVLLHLREGSFEFSEQAFLWSFLREGDIFLDIGAHCGLFSALASQVIGDDGKILAFEPNTDILPFLMANTQRDRVDIHAVALSDVSGEAILSQGGASDTALSSIAYELPNSKHSTVKTQTLDELLATLGIAQVALAKVDVEGSELRLFRGAKETLQKKSVLAFVVEFTEENMRKSGYSAHQLAAPLIEYGYRPYKLATEAADLVPFELLESIEYENILFTHDLATVLDRIRQAPMENAQRSKEIVDRGSAAEALVRSLWSIEKEATKRLALINELTAECRSRDKLVNDLTAQCRSRDQTIAELRRELLAATEGRR